MGQHDFQIFQGIPVSVQTNILAHLPTRVFAKDAVLLREAELNGEVYLIGSGSLAIWKGVPHTPQGVCVATLGAGECFGEMSAINASPSSATVLATSDTQVFLLKLSALPEAGGVREQVTLNLARTLVDRLSNANVSIREKHERELNAMKLIASASAFLTRILTALSFYMFSLPGIALLTPLLPSNSLVSFFFIAAFSWLVVDYMRYRPEVRVAWFHMTLARWPRQVLSGILWAIPLMLVFVVIKLAAVNANPDKFAFFEPMRALGRMGNPDYLLWGVFALVYALLSFAQEFIRCAVQGTLEMISHNTNNGGYWKAIFVSDVVFASIHMHLGALFALQAFIAGFYFGYQFWKARSYLSVAVSHSLVGVWAVFVVGVPR